MSERERPEERAKRRADEMEHYSEQLEEEIDRTRQDWEAKKRDDGVPGAQESSASAERERERQDEPPEEDGVSSGD